ncbi:MAG: hypothetical protein ACUVQ8_03325 [Nitrososphaeria archaeon]
MSAGFFLNYWIGPHIFGHPTIILASGIILVFGMLKFVGRYNWKGPSSIGYRRRSTSISLIILALLQKLDRIRADDTHSSYVVGLAAAVLLILLWRKLKNPKYGLIVEDASLSKG